MEGKALIQPVDDENQQENAVIFRLNDDVAARDVLPLINEKVEIRSFSEYSPSMNEIFIQAVNSNNLQAVPTQTEESL